MAAAGLQLGRLLGSLWPLASAPTAATPSPLRPSLPPSHPSALAPNSPLASTPVPPSHPHRATFAHRNPLAPQPPLPYPEIPRRPPPRPWRRSPSLSASSTSGGDHEWRIDDTRISLLHCAAPVPGASFAYKAAKLQDLQALVLHNHHSRTYTKEALGQSFKLLEINPEAYTAWNYRKLAFQHNLGELSDPEAIKSAVDDVLRVVEIALRKNPKSYGAWYHQKWLLNQKLAPVDFKREFGLLDKLLNDPDISYSNCCHISTFESYTDFLL